MSERAGSDGAQVSSTETPIFAARLSVRYGEVIVAFESGEAGKPLQLPARYHPFLASASDSPDCRVRCVIGEVAADAGELIYEPEDRTWEWRLLGDSRERVIFWYYPAHGEERQAWMAITHDSDFRAVEVTFSTSRRGDPNVLPIAQPVDDYIAARRLAQRGDVVLHACSVITADGAYVFAGHSGAGKSTIAAIAEGMGARILSDDRTILGRDDEGFYAAGTPWQGSFRRGRSESARVRGIFLLVQSSANEIELMTPGRGLGELFVRTIQPTSAIAEVRAVVDTLTALVSRMVVAELRFLPDADAFRLAQAATRAQ